jgi:hypothetical protein
MVGSLRKIWPWKADSEVDSGAVHGAGNTLPPWSVEGAFNPEIAWAPLVALGGFGLVLVLDRLARRRRHTECSEMS